MKPETGLVDGRKRKGVGENGGRIVSKRGRKPGHRVQASSMAIQKLFETCKSVFMGPGTVPHPHHVQFLQKLLDKMKAEDVGLSKDLTFFTATSNGCTPRITCTTIYECENFSMCMFFLPAKAVIPLHNHPGMTVFSKLLFGSMHIKSYDWVGDIKPKEPTLRSQFRLARLKVDSEFTAPCDTAVLYPTTGGNMHTFTAITPCVVLDVLGPPYSSKDGSDCTYYKDHPCPPTRESKTVLEKKRYAWLEEVDVPQESKMYGVEYLGPPIIDNSNVQ